MNEEEKLKKYEGCVLPIIDDWNVYMEISYYDSFPDENSIKTRVENVGSLYEGLADVINFGFYYSYNSKLYSKYEDGTEKVEVGHTHGHSFEEVIREVYYNPESFSIDKEDYELYSKQELIFLNRLKSFLLIAGLKDIDYDDPDRYIKRAKNKRVKELLEYRQYRFKNADLVMDGTIDRLVVPFISDRFLEDEKYLVVDFDGNYLGIVDVVKEKIKLDDIDKYDVNYKKIGFKNISEYKDFIKDKIGDYYDKKYVILEKYKVVELFDVNKHSVD